MNRTNYLKNGISVFAVITVALLISSATAAVPATPNIGLDALSTSPNIEFANIVAGYGNSVYATIFTFGGITTLPVDTSSPGFANAKTWYLASINQEDFATYLQRAPSPVLAPDGLSLTLRYPGSNSPTMTLGWALDAAVAVENAYGVTFDLYFINTQGQLHTYIWYTNSSKMAEVAADVESVSTLGFGTLLSASTITSAPVAWAGYGARTIAGNTVAMVGAGWVDPNGIQEDTTGTEPVYTISSAAIFGGALTPNTNEAQSLARATITVPYPIAPVAGGISPQTSNPLPHVTGIAQWDLRHPVDYYSLGPQSDLVVSYKLATENKFPNIQNKMTVNQTKLNVEGVLEAEFELTNVGSDPASNIGVYFPLGPDFNKVRKNRSMWVIGPDYYLDTTHSAQFTFNLDLTPPAPLSPTSISSDFLDYSGWYRYVANDSLAEWDLSTSEVVLFDNTVSYSGVSAALNITVASNNGFPTAVLDVFYNDVIPAVSGASTYADVINGLQTALKPALKQAFNDSFNTFYQKERIFVTDPGNFTLDSFNYMTAEDTVGQYWFLWTQLNQTLGVGESTTLRFSIDNIPVPTDEFQFMDINATVYTEPTTGLKLPNVTVVSKVQDYYELMQYIFELNEYDGRPISFGFDGSVSFGLDAFNFDQYVSDIYVSFGALMYFENPQGYGFFGLSNGQNLQIADDEAVISAVVSLDKQVYNPGENKTVTVELFNSGDIPAENVKVHLYQASLGRDWRFERRQKIVTLDAGTIAANSGKTLTYSFEANSFVGYSPVFAYVEFISDAGQGPQPVEDFLDVGVTEYQAAGETKNIVMSTLTGSLFAPSNPDLAPTVREPRIEISKTVSDVDANNKFSVTYTIENVGEDDTTVWFGQYWDTNEFTLVSSSDIDALKIESSYDHYAWVHYDQIQLAVGQSVSITLEFELVGDSGTLWPAYAYFSIAGESSLGDTADTGAADTIGSPGGLALAAGSAAQQESQKSATESSASSSYSSSSSVGASINTNVNTKSQEVTNFDAGAGFVGYDALGFLGLMLVPLVLMAYKRRKF